MLGAVSVAAQAEDASLSSSWEGNYAGVLVGAGRLSNRLRDVDGFANWGNPGSSQGYNSNGLVGGAVAGQRVMIDGIGYRYEAEAMLGDLSAHTNRLDPTCTDEAANSRFRWLVAARFGVEKSFDNWRAFAAAGPAIARIVNSVTDTDYSGTSCLERDLRFDVDDSFRRESTRIGWTLGIGVETDLTHNWVLRLDSAHFNFGRKIYTVNHSQNNPCGPGGPRAPCTYTVNNRITALRVALVYRFGN